MFFVHIMYFPLFLLCCNASAFVICAIKNYLLTYLSNAIPDTNHNAEPTNPNRYSKGNLNPTNPNTRYRCE